VKVFLLVHRSWRRFVRNPFFLFCCSSFSPFLPCSRSFYVLNGIGLSSRCCSSIARLFDSTVVRLFSV
jgi:hypothetical protein